MMTIEEMDEEAQRYEYERAVLMMARDHAIVLAGPEKAVVEFEHAGRRWITRWQYKTNPWSGKAYLAWSYPTVRPNLHSVT
jgi:hypothetical protein